MKCSGKIFGQKTQQGKLTLPLGSGNGGCAHGSLGPWTVCGGKIGVRRQCANKLEGRRRIEGE